MRPAPPEPNTPNEGRTQKYRPLVEPDAPKKRERAVTGLIAVSGFAVAVVIDVAVRVLS